LPGAGICQDAASRVRPASGDAAVFAKISASASVVETISSRFIQKRFLSILNDTLISKGHLYYQKPDRLRWELIEPGISGFKIDGDRAERWKGRTDETQSFSVAQVPFIKIFSEQIFAWARADFQKLKKSQSIWVISENPITLRLEPRSFREKDFVDHILIVFAEDTRHIKTVEVHDAEGDSTRIDFFDTIINASLNKDLF